MVVDVAVATAGVGLRDAVVAAGSGVVVRAVAEPGERRGLAVPWVREDFSAPAIGTVRTPWAGFY